MLLVAVPRQNNYAIMVIRNVVVAAVFRKSNYANMVIINVAAAAS